MRFALPALRVREILLLIVYVAIIAQALLFTWRRPPRVSRPHYDGYIWTRRGNSSPSIGPTGSYHYYMRTRGGGYEEVVRKEPLGARGYVWRPGEPVWVLSKPGGTTRTTLDIDVAQMPLSDVLDYISQETGVDLVPVPDGLEAEITIRRTGAGWRALLDAVAEEAGCVVRKIGERRYAIQRAANAGT